MAVRQEFLIGILREAARPGALSREERLQRLQRRRRAAQVMSAAEGFAWLAGSAIVLFLAVFGLFGLRY
ncbi:MAG: hypothetical protein E6J02_00610 [Chloroflexi bacterium]|nr:MAG: hypothetical protein E6J02_00610 [Chloroflexota bacterium]TME13940.1 MAG: hypothetical protein E6I63_14115 [Chloroflexota bacterium]TME20358.1 MAG: hypothetical protein E6I70_01555 [Chloroflexota bacterium]